MSVDGCFVFLFAVQSRHFSNKINEIEMIISTNKSSQHAFNIAKRRAILIDTLSLVGVYY